MQTDWLATILVKMSKVTKCSAHLGTSNGVNRKSFLYSQFTIYLSLLHSWMLAKHWASDAWVLHIKKAVVITRWLLKKKGQYIPSLSLSLSLSHTHTHTQSLCMHTHRLLNICRKHHTHTHKHTHTHTNRFRIQQQCIFCTVP